MVQKQKKQGVVAVSASDYFNFKKKEEKASRISIGITCNFVNNQTREQNLGDEVNFRFN